jgi:hypothetical protein
MTNTLKIEAKLLRKTQLKVGFLLQNIFSLDSKIVCKKGAGMRGRHLSLFLSLTVPLSALLHYCDSVGVFFP